ncbi:MAG: 3-mercaptopyruvate sulfurtransferase [Pseudomonadota bacterium]
MPNLRGRYIVDADWLKEHISAPDLIVVDGTWYLPTVDKDARAEFEAEHIPGAQYFDIDDIADEASDLPHMLPQPAKFASKMKKLGIGDGCRVIAYDRIGVSSAARVWWMLRAMGHEDVAVLDGGLSAWIGKGGAVTEEPTARKPEVHFTPRLNASLIRDLDDMQRIIKTGAAQVVDARSAGRFAGTDPEPRKGLRGGHMPGAVNLSFDKLLTKDGYLRGEGELREAFATAGVDMSKAIVTTCGSGVTASILALALATLGRPDVAVYDGSWSEWAAPHQATEVVT